MCHLQSLQGQMHFSPFPQSCPVSYALFQVRPQVEEFQIQNLKILNFVWAEFLWKNLPLEIQLRKLLIAPALKPGVYLL